MKRGEPPGAVPMDPLLKVQQIFFMLSVLPFILKINLVLLLGFKVKNVKNLHLKNVKTLI